MSLISFLSSVSQISANEGLSSALYDQHLVISSVENWLTLAGMSAFSPLITSLGEISGNIPLIRMRNINTISLIFIALIASISVIFVIGMKKHYNEKSDDKNDTLNRPIDVDL
ncbi:hypothetical protein M9Y10_024303 [Tritrichomonas musculus]|uniref:Uncharacterized protein n=1 Tax=Tritrichomonas musculus TaxID=1915356 RepID=A0ABR2HEH2_9EUKA